MKFKFLLLFALILPMSLLAQRKDKAVYKEYNPGFYGEILEEINKKPESEKPKVLKMDYSGLDLPKSPSEFETVWCNDPLSQGSTGTCWCFSTSSFYESEVFRLTGQQVKLSELYTVYHEYIEKAREYVRTRGESFFGEGSETNAVKRMMKVHGMVPASAYEGKKEGQKFHDHRRMFHEMESYLQSVKATNAWNEEEVLATIKNILNHYMGVPPKTVTVKGKEITPQEYMTNVLKLKPDDYVDFMSLMEKPYYTKALYNVPDNWWKSEDYYNVPLDDFMTAVKSAVKNGYSLSIGGDVSESGMDSEHEVAMVPTYDIPSKFIDENARQFRFANKTTTDDHAIHLIGISERPDGTWFLIKDSGSGGFTGPNKGYWFYHEDYVKLKMMSFTVHKDAVKEILKKFKNT